MEASAIQPLEEQIVKITLVVKTETNAEAVTLTKQKLLLKLNQWVVETAGQRPQPEGALLFYNVTGTER